METVKETVKELSSVGTQKIVAAPKIAQPKLPELTLEAPVVNAPVVDAPEVAKQNVVSSFFTKLISNKNYIYVLLLVIVLALIGYYLYMKYFSKKTEKKSKEDKSEEKVEKVEGKKEEKKNILNPQNEYYIIDPNGNPILLTPYFLDIMKHNMSKENPDLNQLPMPKPPTQMAQLPTPSLPQMNPPMPAMLPTPQPRQQKSESESESDSESESEESSSEKAPVQKQRPRLSHPGETQIPDNVMLTEAEDDNIANQDLTNDEIIELKRQLDIMQKNQNYHVTAQNDEDD